MAIIAHRAKFHFSSAGTARAFTAAALALTGAILATANATAQTVYRSVDANGRVTFSDLPPSNARQVAPIAAGRDSASPSGSLPFELRSVVAKYPVTLYTSADCAPCDDGRTLLRTRGVPFTEKTVSKPEDVESLKRLSNTTSLPLLAVGAHQLKGFASGEWAQYLSFAGYPETSALPATYRNPAPSPLVAVQPPAAAAAPASAPAEPATVAPLPPPPSNPAGIRF